MRRLRTTALLLVLVLAASMATRAEQPRTRDSVRRYRDMARREPDRIEVDSLQLLRVGQQLREAGQLPDAQAVFRFVAEEFPGWALGYLGLAELARTRGDREEAARAYRRALEIDPEHRAAREGLAEMEVGSRE